jgi:hypothetical protein
MFDRFQSWAHWRLAKANRASDKRKFAAHLLAATRHMQPDDPKLGRAIAMLIDERLLDEARAICSQRAPNDKSGYFELYTTCIDELKQPRLTGTRKVALFNDTDFRVNMGCRLTSQGLKSAIRDAVPDAEIISVPFDFRTFRKEFPSALPEDAGLEALEERLAIAFGPSAMAVLKEADLVLLQPEGSLDHDSNEESLKAFFTPVLIAQHFGKAFAVLNGTIPIYPDGRDGTLKSLFRKLGQVAARDEISAEHYDIAFLPDAALLRFPPVAARPGKGCLITTGARNRPEEDVVIVEKALAVCDALALRPVVLTHASDRFLKFRDAVLARGGVFAETASLEEAARVLSECRLHIGGRYHMTIFSILCGVPTLLFDVRTHKNQWLPRYSDLVQIVSAEDLVPLAREAMRAPAAVPSDLPGLRSRYGEFLGAAASGRPAVDGAAQGG